MLASLIGLFKTKKMPWAETVYFTKKIACWPKYAWNYKIQFWPRRTFFEVKKKAVKMSPTPSFYFVVKFQWKWPDAKCGLTMVTEKWPGSMKDLQNTICSKYNQKHQCQLGEAIVIAWIKISLCNQWSYENTTLRSWKADKLTVTFLFADAVLRRLVPSNGDFYKIIDNFRLLEFHCSWRKVWD